MTEKYRRWRKSRHSDPNGHCVEVARATDGTIGVRDSKTPRGEPILEFASAEWATFLAHIRNQA